MTLTTEKAAGIMSAAFSKKGDEMKKYLILSDTLADNKKVKAGDVIELSEAEGNILIGYKKAEIATVKETKKKSDRSVGLEKSETPTLKKRTKK
jgi:hypothetical protein